MSKAALFVAHILACLPLEVLHLLSDALLYPVVRHVIRYRRDVVEKNLALAFPQKSDEERQEIERRFYHFLCDVVVETAKMERMSEEELKRRFAWENIDEVMRSPTDEKPFTLCLFAHYGNWEWSIASFLSGNDNLSAFFYQPLHNKAFNEFTLKNRTRHGVLAIEAPSVSGTLESLRTNGQRCIVNVAPDQLPKEQYVRHFCQFMGIKTKVITGTESLICRYNMNVYICRVARIKRGVYSCRAERLDYSPGSGNGQWPVTDAYFEHLQRQIGNQPELWLWSHDRWRR